MINLPLHCKSWEVNGAPISLLPLTNSGLVTSYGVIEFGQIDPGDGLVPTRTNVNLSSVRSCGNCLKGIQEEKARQSMKYYNVFENYTIKFQPCRMHYKRHVAPVIFTNQTKTNNLHPLFGIKTQIHNTSKQAKVYSQTHHMMRP